MTKDEIAIRAMGWESYIAFLRDKGMTYTAIAKKTNRSLERVRQVHQKYLRRQRQRAAWLQPARPYVLALTEELTGNFDANN